MRAGPHPVGTSSHPSVSLPRRRKPLCRAAAVACGLLPALLLADPPQRFVPGRILVKTRASASDKNLPTPLRARAGSERRLLGGQNILAVSVDEASAEAVMETLRRDPSVEFVERDFLAEAALLPDDPAVLNGSAWHLEKIQAPSAWNTSLGSNVVVAVLDSGVNYLHPDLAPSLLPGHDFVEGDADPSDDFGHGTAVAGVVAATGNNGFGLAGVAFGAKILPVKVMDAFGYAAYSAIADGIHYAVDHGARVINLSVAGSEPSATLQSAIDYAWSNNVIVVAAAGNTASDAPQYPAACASVVAVAATTAEDSLAKFSSFGTNIALAAPGEAILTTTRNLTTLFAAGSGTSLACPMVAAGAALVTAVHPALTNSQIVTLLEQTADDVGAAGLDSMFGFGRLNVARAVSVAASLAGEDQGTPPPVSPPSLPRETPLPPSVSIISPTTNTSVAIGATLPIHVQAAAASTNNHLTNVVLLLDGAEFQSAAAAPFALNWKPLVAGDYSWSAAAADDAGRWATSAVVAVRVCSNFVKGVFVAPLAVTIHGSGSVKPNLHGSQLTVGRSYNMTAVPAAGQVFAGWGGLALTNPLKPKLTFAMQPGLELAASFIPNPFLAARGTFTGLIWNTNGVTPESSGRFTLTVAALGSFSGKLVLGGSSHSFRGALDFDGNASVVVTRKTAAPLALTLHVALAAGADETSGTVSDGGFAADLLGDRNVFSSLSPAGQAGKRAFVLQLAGAGTNFTAKALSNISTSGRTTVAGALKDGRRFSLSSVLAKSGDLPFYVALNRTEAMIGWLNFPAGTTNTAGTIHWVKSGTNAFSVTLQAALAF